MIKSKQFNGVLATTIDGLELTEFSVNSKTQKVSMAHVFYKGEKIGVVKTGEYIVIKNDICVIVNEKVYEVFMK